MTNDEIPNDERNPNAEARMTKTGSAGVAVMADMGGKGRTFNIQHSTFNAQRSTTGSADVAVMAVKIGK